MLMLPDDSPLALPGQKGTVQPTAPKPKAPAALPAAAPGGTLLPSQAPAPLGPVQTAGAAPAGSTITSTAANVPTTSTALPPLAPAALPAPTPIPPGSVGSGVTTTPTNPAAPLTGQTIARSPAVDRFKLAQERFGTFEQGTAPAFEAALRRATREGAAAGGLGSGELRTTYGDLGLARTRELGGERERLMQNALEGTIGDAFGDVGIAQQQQGFQNQQQQQAFENELRRLGFSEEMLNSAFGRALQTYMAGQSGGTGSGTGIAVGNQIAGQGQDTLTALQNLIRNRSAGTGGRAPVGTVPGRTVPTTPGYNPNAPLPPWMGGGQLG